MASVYSMGNDGIFYALNANTGALIWKYATGYGVSGVSPAVANGMVYVEGGTGNLYALNASTGVLLWTYASAGGFGIVLPAVANGVVYAGGQGNDVYALDASTGALLWQFTANAVITSSPAVVNGMVYICDRGCTSTPLVCPTSKCRRSSARRRVPTRLG